ncbi:MAG TPA: NUDIX hydrolase [Anaerolineales bacterium]|nr:NUDIX hydrolase [Anaerolineales bacterium]
MFEFKVVSSQILFDNPYAKVVLDTLEYEGIQRPYFYLTSPVEAVATVSLTGEGCIILTHQYRHPVGKVIYDLPAGHLEPGENPIQGARREFEEETGYYPRSMEPLGYYNQFPGVLRAATNLFFAKDLVKTAPHLEPGEILETVHMPVSQVLKLILDGEIIDGSLQLGVLLALQKGKFIEVNAT